jgi:hypothetical protein
MRYGLSRLSSFPNHKGRNQTTGEEKGNIAHNRACKRYFTYQKNGLEVIGMSLDKGDGEIVWSKNNYTILYTQSILQDISFVLNILKQIGHLNLKLSCFRTCSPHL